MKTVPVMLYDGDCAFCQRWIEKWRRTTGEGVLYEPYQQALAGHPQVTEQQCREAVRLIMPGGTVYSGAHAVLLALSLGGKCKRLLRCYEKWPWFGRVSEWCYRTVAAYRTFLSGFYKLPQCRR